jgi:hypothetical protein
MLYSNYNKNYFKFTLSNVLLFIAISSLEVFRLYFLPFCCCCCSHGLLPREEGPDSATSTASTCVGLFGLDGSQDSAFASPREEGPGLVWFGLFLSKNFRLG